MAKSIVSAGTLLALLTGLGVGAPPPVVLGTPTEYSHAGVSLAWPKGFQDRPLSSLYDIVNAVVLEKDRPVQAVTLSAFPVASETTAEAYADTKMAELKKNLAIRHLKLLKKTPMPVAGLNGSARLMSYTFRGDKTLAAQVYFIRVVKSSEIRICYLLTVVCSADKQPRLLPMLGAVIRSVRLTAVRHPDLTVPAGLGEAIRDFKLGYSLRQPRQWYGVQSGVGVEMGQVDHLLGGVSMPSAVLLVHGVSGKATTSEACAKESLDLARTLAAKRKETCKVLFQGLMKLGGRPAYQFALVQSSEKPPPLRGTKSAGSVAIVQRTVCVPARGGESTKAFMLIVTARGEDAQAAQGLMATLARGFSLLGPTSQPTTAPTTKPTTRPTSKPAAPAPAAKKAAPAKRK
ncbi:MAG TPA: DcrB-related protein [Phycisphaerae bacterium]|nr:DcrB-related protein [Phycisphaerae bacterium]